MLTEPEIRKALRPVTAPEIGMSVVDLGMIREVAISWVPGEQRLPGQRALLL